MPGQPGLWPGLSAAALQFFQRAVEPVACVRGCPSAHPNQRPPTDTRPNPPPSHFSPRLRPPSIPVFDDTVDT
jgi:hypothetical protein